MGDQTSRRNAYLREDDAAFFGEQSHSDFKVRKWDFRFSFARPYEDHVDQRSRQFSAIDASYNIVYERLLLWQKGPKAKVQLVFQLHCVERHHPFSFVKIQSVLSVSRA